MSQTKEQERERILKLAREGDPKVLAALLNHKLRTQGITVDVAWKENHCLNIVLESAEAPDEQELVNLIAKAMNKLQAEPVEAIEIHGCRRGEKNPDWVRTIAPDKTSLQEALSVWLEGNLALPSLQDSHNAAEREAYQQDFLRFHLSSKDTALLEIAAIKEVLSISLADILPVPHMSDRLLGVYNWRGEMLWLVDINRLLGFSGLGAKGSYYNNRLDASSGGGTSVLVLQVDDQVLGLVVSRIDDIERHDLQPIQPANAGLFTPQILPFARGYLTEANAIVLDAQAIVAGVKQLGYSGI